MNGLLKNGSLYLWRYGAKMVHCIVWKCVVCDGIVAKFTKHEDEILLSSYRVVSDNDKTKFGRICVGCNRSTHNYTRKRKVRVRT